MGCEIIRLPDGGTAIACGGRQARRKCPHCGQLGVLRYLCDREVGPRGKTCDSKMCEACRTPAGPDRDYCPLHAGPWSGGRAAPEEKTMARKEIFNELSWSNSLGNNLAECPRKVWLGRFGSWQGWPTGSGDQQAKRLYMLKKLKSRHGWLGDLVHRGIKDILDRYRRGDRPTPEQSSLRWVAAMRGEFAASRRKDYLQIRQTIGLIEHHYGLEVSERSWKELAEKLERCLHNLHQSAAFRELVGAHEEPFGEEEWLETEELSSMMIAGVKVWVQLDHAWRRSDGSVEIIDWKTGREPRQKDLDQAAVYAAYGAEKWGVRIEQVRTRLVYLDDGQEIIRTACAADVEALNARVQADIAEFWARAMVVDQETGHCTAPMEAWPMTTDQKICRWCEFQGECGR